MKITGEVKIKDNITIYDLEKVIDTIVPFVIRKENEIEYTPHYKDIGFKVGVIKHLVNGVEFEEDDNILDYITTKELVEILTLFDENYESEKSYILTNAEDIIEYKKQVYLQPDYSDIKDRLLKSIEQEQTLNELSIKYAENQNKLLLQQIKANEYNERVISNMTAEEVAELNKKLASGEFDVNKVAEIAIDKYLNSPMIHKE